MQVLWLKRDLRLSDHEPLRLALEQSAAAGPVLVLYCHEPALLGKADASAQHVGFVQESLADIARDLRARGSDLLEVTLGAPETLALLHLRTPVRHLWAYAETTHQTGFARDKQVRHWARENHVRFHELAQNAVRRGSQCLTEKFDFGAHLKAATQADLWVLPSRHTGLLPLKRVARLRDALARASDGASLRSPLQCVQAHQEPGWLAAAPRPQRAPTEDKVFRLAGGRSAAMEHLSRFLAPANLVAYPAAISSPLAAQTHCSRLSPYLAWGVVSDREVLQALSRSLAANATGVPAEAERELSAARFFAERLYWRSSYLQLAENHPEVDQEPGLSAFQHLRAGERMNGWLQCWAAGQTGFPLVDAAMRMLNATGWLNMRLRGTVTSFALNDLWLPWQEVGLVLAREFLDYEPAIHWNQLQIHAGESRFSTPLTYDVVKQARDHDPLGVFVRQWVPELKDLPTAHLFEPWRAPGSVQAAARCVIGEQYPAPLVRYPVANDAARQRVAALREGREPSALAYWKARTKDVAMQGQAALF